MFAIVIASECEFGSRERMFARCNVWFLSSLCRLFKLGKVGNVMRDRLSI